MHELRPGVYRFDLGGVNAYLVEDGDDLVLVDAGMPWHAGDVRRGIADAGHAVTDVDRVLLTHYDFDHVGGLSGLTPDLAAPVLAAEPDASHLTGDRRPSWRSRKGAFQRLAGALVTPPALEVRRIGDGDRLGGFTAYRTPGHTPGHVSYVHADAGAALLGDLVREADGGLRPSPWAVTHDADAVDASIGSLLDRAPDFEAACPGHGTPITEGGRDALA